MEIAKASTPVLSTNSTASSGSVKWVCPEPTPSSIPPRVPSSPSTVTPVVGVFYNFAGDLDIILKVDGVLESSIKEPSIITEVQPKSMARFTVSKLLP